MTDLVQWSTAGLAGAEARANKDIPAGYAGLDAAGLLKQPELPAAWLGTQLRVAPPPSGDITGATDTAALNALATVPNILVLLHDGVYWANASLAPAVNTAVIGFGEDITIIRAAAGSNLANGVIYLAAAGAAVHDLTVDGNKANVAGGAGIVGVAASRLRVTGCRITACFAQGVYLYHCSDCLVADNDFDAIANVRSGSDINAATLLNGCSRTRIRDNRTDACLDVSIILYNAAPACTDTTITGNIIRNSGDIGIALGNANRTTVSNNNILGCFGNGIDTGNSIDTTVTGNTITTCNAGIIGDGSSTPGVANAHTYTGNTIRTTVNNVSNPYGIYLASISGASISGNTIVGAAAGGIALVNCTDSTVAHNTVKNSNGAGITAFNSTGITLTGNRCFDDQGVKTQTYGIVSNGTSDYITCVGNDCRGNLTGTIALVGTHNVTAGNQP